jgi:hypothetical protein
MATLLRHFSDDRKSTSFDGHSPSAGNIKNPSKLRLISERNYFGIEPRGGDDIKSHLFTETCRESRLSSTNSGKSIQHAETNCFANVVDKFFFLSFNVCVDMCTIGDVNSDFIYLQIISIAIGSSARSRVFTQSA